MKDFAKDALKYTIGPVLAVVLLFGALKFSPPQSTVVPNLPTVNTPAPEDRPAEPPAKIIRSFVTKNDSVIDVELEAKITAVMESGADGEYHYVGYPDKGKLKRKRIVIQDLDAPPPAVPPVVVSPPATPGPSTPGPVIKGSQITYVYEKDDGAVPPHIYGALQTLATKVSLASTFEEDTVDGSGETPDQFKLPLAEAKKEGLPALVYTKDSAVIKVIKAPKTEAEALSIAP